MKLSKNLMIGLGVLSVVVVAAAVWAFSSGGSEEPVAEDRGMGAPVATTPVETTPTATETTPTSLTTETATETTTDVATTTDTVAPTATTTAPTTATAPATN
jgi:hypothetical protein